MTSSRSLMTMLLAMIVLIATRGSGEEQYPHGLMSAAPTASGNRTCTIDVRPVSFGTYDPLHANPVNAVGQVIYVCGNLSASGTAQDNKAIRIELTTGSANTFSPRRMSGGTGSDFLDYNLYLDPTHRTIWGQGAFGTDVYVDAKPPNKTPVTVPIYGQILGLQDVAAGQYADALTARIVF
jgi:spore coat protein U-like protein